MRHLVMKVESLKKGYKYTILDGETVIDTRTSDRVYVAASVAYRPGTDSHLRPLYHGKLSLVGKGESGKMAKCGYEMAVAKVVE